MDAKKRTEELIQWYSPHKTRKQSVFYGVLTGIGGKQETNQQRTILGRALDSYRRLNSDLNFLAGMLTLLPFLKSKRTIQFRDEGEKILSEADELMNGLLGDRKPTVKMVRKMRVCGEKIMKLRAKIAKEMKAS
jgi:hypothetical protein